MRFLVFGGTTEGRELADWLSCRGCEVTVFSATGYGAALVRGGPRVESRVGPLSPQEMRELMRAGSFACVVDATHPYATKITADVARAAADAGLERLRVVRESEPQGSWTGCGDAADAAAKVRDVPGRVLLTTGTKELELFASALPDFAERLYVRVLPVPASIERTREAGIPPSHVIAMQGPFSRELNVALIREFGISALVTKASGAAGGFWEKIEAARECGVRAFVIHRPLDEAGYSVEETKRELEARYGI